MNPMNFPVLVWAISLVALYLATLIGDGLRKRIRPLPTDEREDFNVVLGAALTMLGLLIGFTFSMAVARYDLRKSYEHAETNAIGTEYVRAELLQDADGDRIRGLLKSYLNQRVLFYTVRNPQRRAKIYADTEELQNELWAATRAGVASVRTPVAALVASGMNDVLNSQGYTQAAWWNRIPVAAWILMMAIALACNLLIGYSSRRTAYLLFLILPIMVSIAFFLISDIDSPVGGAIRVSPQNLSSLAQSLH
jgi:hypothetical protein